MSVPKKLWALVGGVHTQAHAGAPTPWRSTHWHIHGHRWARAVSHALRLIAKIGTSEQRLKHTRCEAAAHTGTNTEHTHREAPGWGTDSTPPSAILTETQEHMHTQACTQTHADVLPPPHRRRHKCRHMTHIRTAFVVLRKGDPDTQLEQKHTLLSDTHTL